MLVLALLVLVLLPPAVTLLLPSRWLMLWILALVAAGSWMLVSAQAGDSPGAFAAFGIGVLLLSNLWVVVGRFVFTLVAAERGYGP